MQQNGKLRVAWRGCGLRWSFCVPVLFHFISPCYTSITEMMLQLDLTEAGADEVEWCVWINKPSLWTHIFTTSSREPWHWSWVTQNTPQSSLLWLLQHPAIAYSQGIIGFRKSQVLSIYICHWIFLHERWYSGPDFSNQVRVFTKKLGSALSFADFVLAELLPFFFFCKMVVRSWDHPDYLMGLRTKAAKQLLISYYENKNWQSIMT